MSHSRATSGFAALLLPLALAAGPSGCAAPVGAEESTATSQEGLTKMATVGASTFATEMTAIGLAQTSLEIKQDIGTFTPPPLLVSRGLMQPFNFYVPDSDQYLAPDGSHPGGRLLAHKMSLATVTLAPEGQYLAAHATLTGDYFFDPDVFDLIAIDIVASVTLRFSPDAKGHLLFLDAAATVVSQHVSGCNDGLNVCAPVAASLVPFVTARVQQRAAAFGAKLAPSLSTAWLYDLRANANTPWGAPAAWVWDVTQSTVAILGSSISFTAFTYGGDIPPAGQ